MKNIIICKSCNTENPYFGFTCTQCNSYLRERVVNIDLWSTMGKIVESPVKAFSGIIHAEHKNFIFFIYSLFAFKFFINALLISDPLFGSIKLLERTSLLLLASVAVPLLIILLFSWLIKKNTGIFKLRTRFKDNFSILIYSLLPNAVALVFFLPVELVLFGSALFISNPSPFILKPNPAWAMTVLELLMILWSAILTGLALYSYTRSRLYSFISASIFHILIWGTLYLMTWIFNF